MDEIDLAQRQSEEFLYFALREQKWRREADNNTGTDCTDCGAEIPLKRLELRPGCLRCLSCQVEYENLLYWRTL